MYTNTHLLTGEQIRAARALARIEQADLAQRCGLSLETIKRLERIRGPAVANVRTLNAIAAAFEALDIRFDISEDGKIGVTRSKAAERRAEPSGQPPAMTLQRLIYYSTARVQTPLGLQQVLSEILDASSARNGALGVTGCLFVCDGRFLQVIEGAREAVWQVYGAISTDPRHQALVTLENRAVSTPLFPDWSLCCGQFAADDSLFAAEPAFADGFRPESLTPSAALGLLAMVRDLQGKAPRDDRGDPSGCSLAAACRDPRCGAFRNLSAV